MIYLREIPELSEKQKKKFWDNINKEINYPCWTWKGGVFQTGLRYGIFSIGSNNFYVHRISYTIHYPDEDISQKLVLHECDFPLCINPWHLYLGDHNDNMKDCIDRKRHISPSNRCTNKLNEELVKEIRFKFEKGYTQKELLKEYNISKSQINKIILRQKWKHI